MSCRTCGQAVGIRHALSVQEIEKTRRLAARIAELDGKTQIILEYEGNISITCEECWIKGGRIGRVIEYFIV